MSISPNTCRSLAVFLFRSSSEYHAAVHGDIHSPARPSPRPLFPTLNPIHWQRRPQKTT
ncbi:hypothetical protein BDZ97DRAFT_1845855 [Flammula alnicola]|nr:hypothetical protein BDZ97DRAFT_1845855 [Flammula alnicola]